VLLPGKGSDESFRLRPYITRESFDALDQALPVVDDAVDKAEAARLLETTESAVDYYLRKGDLVKATPRNEPMIVGVPDKRRSVLVTLESIAVLRKRQKRTEEFLDVEGKPCLIPPQIKKKYPHIPRSVLREPWNLPAGCTLTLSRRVLDPNSQHRPGTRPGTGRAFKYGFRPSDLKPIEDYYAPKGTSGTSETPAAGANGSGSTSTLAIHKPVVLGNEGTPVIVLGQTLPKLSSATYDVVKALVDAGDAGLSLSDLSKNSGHDGPHVFLKRLTERFAEWAQVIKFPGKPWGKYCITRKA
jgi:hypothetical protein